MDTQGKVLYSVLAVLCLAIGIHQLAHEFGSRGAGAFFALAGAGLLIAPLFEKQKSREVVQVIDLVPRTFTKSGHTINIDAIVNTRQYFSGVTEEGQLKNIEEIDAPYSFKAVLSVRLLSPGAAYMLHAADARRYLDTAGIEPVKLQSSLWQEVGSLEELERPGKNKVPQ